MSDPEDQESEMARLGRLLGELAFGGPRRLPSIFHDDEPAGTFEFDPGGPHSIIVLGDDDEGQATRDEADA